MPRLFLKSKSGTKNSFGNVPRWIKFTKTFTDFSTAGLTSTITLFTPPPGTYIHNIKMKHSVVFAGGAIASYTISVGSSSGAATVRYLGASSVAGAVTITNMFTSVTSSGAFEAQDGSSSITATATSTAANLDQATTGSVDIWVLYSPGLV